MRTQPLAFSLKRMTRHALTNPTEEGDHVTTNFSIFI